MNTLDWEERAECRRYVADFGQEAVYAIFFPAGPGSGAKHYSDPYAAAREICSACSSKQECLDWAIACSFNLDGMWGGLDPGERAKLRRQMPKPAPTTADTKWCPDCGTYRPVGDFYLRHTGVKAGELSAYCKTHNGQRTTEYARRRRQGAA